MGGHHYYDQTSSELYPFALLLEAEEGSFVWKCPVLTVVGRYSSMSFLGFQLLFKKCKTLFLSMIFLSLKVDWWQWLNRGRRNAFLRSCLGEFIYIYYRLAAKALELTFHVDTFCLFVFADGIWKTVIETCCQTAAKLPFHADPFCVLWRFCWCHYSSTTTSEHRNRNKLVIFSQWLRRNKCWARQRSSLVLQENWLSSYFYHCVYMLQPLFSFAKKKIKKKNQGNTSFWSSGKGDNKLSLPDKVLPVN